jgi:hypothetical protein
MWPLAESKYCHDTKGVLTSDSSHTAHTTTHSACVTHLEDLVAGAGVHVAADLDAGDAAKCHSVLELFTNLC